MILETSWGTPTGWIIVRDVLLIGPWHHDADRSRDLPPHAQRLRGRAHPAAHHPVRLGRGADGDGLRAGARLRPRARRAGSTPATSYHQGRATRRRARDVTLTLTTDMLLGFEGGQASARTLLKEGDVRFVALSWGGAEPPHDVRRRLRAAGVDRPPLAALAGPRTVPRPPLAQLPPAQRADPQGPDLLPDRRGRPRPAAPRCRRRRAATATTTTATPGSATRRSRCGGCTPSASTGRPSTSSRSSPTCRAATRTSRSCTASAASGSSRSTSSTTSRATPNSRPVRIGNAAYSQRQHDVWGALLDSVYLHSKAADHLDNRIWPILDKQVGRGAQALARAGRRHLGGARRAEALHVVEDHVLGRGRPRREAGPDDRRGRQGGGVGAGRRRDQAGHPGQRRRRARRASRSTTAVRRSTRRCCSRRCCASCRPTTRGSGRR